jgi:hypothetical protein
VQHKRAEQEKTSDFESFKKTFLAQVAGGANAGNAGATGPQPPPGNRMEIVVVQCDIVTVIHKAYRQDPTEQPGKFYEAFTFDAYRVRNGKVVEHWDDNSDQCAGTGGRKPITAKRREIVHEIT